MSRRKSRTKIVEPDLVIRTLRPAVVAERLGVSIDWVRRRMRSGELRVFRYSTTSVGISEESVIELQRAAEVTR